MLLKFIFWVVLLAIEAVVYPSLYNGYLQITHDPLWYSGNPFMRWDLVFATHDGIQIWLAFNIGIIIVLVIMANNKSSMANEADNSGAYGTARFMSIDELNSLYPSYDVTSDQKNHKGLYKITKRFKSKAEADRWKKKK
jgi:hypothetical protein